MTGLAVTFTDFTFLECAVSNDDQGKLLDSAYEARVHGFLDELVWMSRTLKWGRINLPSKHHPTIIDSVVMPSNAVVVKRTARSKGERTGPFRCYSCNTRATSRRSPARCRKLVTRRALISAGASAVPLPGIDVAVDVTVLLQMIEQINQRFRFDAAANRATGAATQALCLQGRNGVG